MATSAVTVMRICWALPRPAAPDATRRETEAGRSLGVLLRQAFVGGSAAQQISDRCGLVGVDVPLGLAGAFQELGEGPVGLGTTTSSRASIWTSRSAIGSEGLARCQKSCSEA